MNKKKGKMLLAALFFLLCFQSIVYGGENISALKNEIEELRQEQKALYKELKMIRDILLKRGTPTRSQINVRDVEFELGDNPVKGDEFAPLVLVEFSDYQCSFCARYAKETYPEIFEKYIKTGMLRYAFVDKPLPSHNKANEAAEAAHCAAEQGKFHEMHEEMLFNPESIDDLTKLASSLYLDIQKFESCMKNKKYSEKVAANLSLANKLNVLSVPGFVIASRDPHNSQKVKGISFIRGAKPFIQFQKEIEQALEVISKPE